MSFFSVKNVAIKGISVCVPHKVEKNAELPLFSKEEAERLVAATGISEKRVVDDNTTPSDLCTSAARDLLNGIQWSSLDVDCLIYVSTNRDFLQPNTSCIIHNNLKLRDDCFAIDVPCGCPGWIYGLYIIGTMIQNSQMRKGLLLVGDTSTRMNYPGDKSTRPLFGDAGSATAVEFSESAKSMDFSFLTESSGWGEIITVAGGARNPFRMEHLVPTKSRDGYDLRPLDSEVHGLDVFSFSISKPPAFAESFLDECNITPESFDLFLCHQANKYIVDKIRKKLRFPKEKTPLSLNLYGNTSNVSIPLTMVSQCSKKIAEKENNVLALAFGTGLMCGVSKFSVGKCYNNIIEY